MLRKTWNVKILFSDKAEIENILRVDEEMILCTNSCECEASKTEKKGETIDR